MVKEYLCVYKHHFAVDIDKRYIMINVILRNYHLLL